MHTSIDIPPRYHPFSTPAGHTLYSSTKQLLISRENNKKSEKRDIDYGSLTCFALSLTKSVLLLACNTIRSRRYMMLPAMTFLRRTHYLGPSETEKTPINDRESAKTKAYN
ncbi:unnamed protein product [Ectocarpus fasciculatus]